MPSSSFFLKASAVLSALSTTTSAALYKVQDTYEGESFLKGFSFFDKPDPTNGHVKYLSKEDAAAKGLTKLIGNDQYIGVDYNNIELGGRSSVRIEGTKKYQHGLFILDLKHMPGGICGTWPAFWTYNTEQAWPKLGEIDIIEGVNQNNANKFVIHTDTKCSVDGTGQTGTQSLYNCALDSASGPSGCDVNAAEANTFGAGFNSNGGGVYAMEWTSAGIKMWFFPRSGIPASITADAPNTAEFGTPNANFQGNCNMDERFINQQFVFDTTFCGDWGGNVYAQSGCPMYSGLDGMASCKKFVSENPGAFKNAYWQISYFKSYTVNSAVSSSSSVASSATSSSLIGTSSHVSGSSSIPQSSSSSVRFPNATISTTAPVTSSASSRISGGTSVPSLTSSSSARPSNGTVLYHTGASPSGSATGSVTGSGSSSSRAGYSTKPTTTDAPVYGTATVSSRITLTTTYTTTYVDICPTGFTTKTTTQTVTYCPTTTPSVPGKTTTVSSYAPPPGMTVTTTVCTVCAATPTTVTLTIPCTTTPIIPPTSSSSRRVSISTMTTPICVTTTVPCSACAGGSSTTVLTRYTTISSYPQTSTRPPHFATSSVVITKASTVYPPPSSTLVCNGTGCPPPSSIPAPPPSTRVASSSMVVCNGAGCPPPPSSTPIVCYGAECPPPSSVPAPPPPFTRPVPSSVVVCNGAGCPPPSSSTPAVCYGAGCPPPNTTPVPPPPSTKPATSTPVVCNGAGCPPPDTTPVSVSRPVASSVGISVGTVSSSRPSTTAPYDSYFTGAANGLRVGGCVAGGVAAVLVALL